MYKIIELLNISKSLLSQSEKKDNHPGDVHKAVITDGVETKIVYFLYGIDAGTESTLEIFDSAMYPLIYKNDYRIVKQEEYSINEELIKKLLNRKSK